jgi:GTPase SAR1 family protein
MSPFLSSLAPRFGALVIGPPGSGKTTFSRGLAQMLPQLKRKTLVVNLDPANDDLDFSGEGVSVVDVMELVSVDRVMQEYGLGPNGALVWAMEYLMANMDWLEGRYEFGWGVENRSLLEEKFSEVSGRISVSKNDPHFISFLLFPV